MQQTQEAVACIRNSKQTAHNTTQLKKYVPGGQLCWFSLFFCPMQWCTWKRVISEHYPVSKNMQQVAHHGGDSAVAHVHYRVCQKRTNFWSPFLNLSEFNPGGGYKTAIILKLVGEKKFFVAYIKKRKTNFWSQEKLFCQFRNFWILNTPAKTQYLFLSKNKWNAILWVFYLALL